MMAGHWKTHIPSPYFTTSGVRAVIQPQCQLEDYQALGPCTFCSPKSKCQDQHHKGNAFKKSCPRFDRFAILRSLSQPDYLCPRDLLIILWVFRVTPVGFKATLLGTTRQRWTNISREQESKGASGTTIGPEKWKRSEHLSGALGKRGHLLAPTSPSHKALGPTPRSATKKEKDRSLPASPVKCQRPKATERNQRRHLLPSYSALIGGNKPYIPPLASANWCTDSTKLPPLEI